MSNYFSKSLLSFGALSVLALASVSAIQPAQAQEALCSIDLRACQKRCMRVYGSWTQCRYRICGPQFDRCMADALWSAPRTTYVFNLPRPRGPIGNPASNVPPKGPGPIDLPPTANGNGGIVPQGHKPGNGGIVPAAHSPSPSEKR